MRWGLLSLTLCLYACDDSGGSLEGGDVELSEARGRRS